MKAKITKKDGTVIELEGTAAELGPIIDPPKPQCPSIGDTVDLGKLIDELMKGQKDSEPYQPQYPVPPITWPQIVYNDMCPMGGPHDYPTVWMSVSQPACSKCGKSGALLLGTTVLCTQNIEGELVENGTKYVGPTIPFVSAFTIVPPASQS